MKSLQLGTAVAPRDTRWYSPSAGSAHSLYCSGVQKGASPAGKGRALSAGISYRCCKGAGDCVGTARKYHPLPTICKGSQGWHGQWRDCSTCPTSACRGGLFLKIKEGGTGNFTQGC